MAITVQAIVENGLLRPTQPLPFGESTRLRITIEVEPNWVDETRGLCGWKGNADDLRRLAVPPDFELEEA